MVEEFDYVTGCLLDVLDELGARLTLRDLMEKLKSIGVSAKLIIHEGKRHGWKEVIETEPGILNDWFVEPFKSGAAMNEVMQRETHKCDHPSKVQWLTCLLSRYNSTE